MLLDKGTDGGIIMIGKHPTQRRYGMTSGFTNAEKIMCYALLAVALFGVAVYTAALILTALQACAVLLGLWP